MKHFSLLLKTEKKNKAYYWITNCSSLHFTQNFEISTKYILIIFHQGNNNIYLNESNQLIRYKHVILYTEHKKLFNLLNKKYEY